jgi:hypothetical protein
MYRTKILVRLAIGTVQLGVVMASPGYATYITPPAAPEADPYEHTTFDKEERHCA